MQLGAAASLLLGLRPEWTSARGGPWPAPLRQPFVLHDVEVEARAAWREPVLSLHDGADDLIDAIFDFRVLPFRIPASALMRRDSVSERLDIGLSAETRYLLVQLRREDADFTYQGGRNCWTAEGRHAMGRLRTGERIFDGVAREAIVTPRQARRYLDYCYDFGTHFVSRIVAGDAVVQVFACNPSRSRQVKETILREAGAASVSGPLARSLGVFTRPEWIAARGRIVSASGDAELERIEDVLAVDPASLPVHRVAPVTIGLSPQSSLMEVFRSGVFRRVVNGALLQKYGPRIRVPVAPRDLCVPEEFTFPSAACRSGDSLTAFSVLLHDTPPIAEKRVAICAYRTSPRVVDGLLPVLALSDEAFDGCELVTHEMEGGLFLTNGDGSRRETLFEGLRFAGDERVELRSDPLTPSHDVAAEARRTIDYAETLLRRPSSRKEEVDFARGYLEWLAPMSDADRPRILYLARAALPWGRGDAAIDAAEGMAIAQAAARLAIETRHVMMSGGAGAALAAALRGVADRVGAMPHAADPPIAFGEEAAAARARALRAAEKAGERTILDMLSSKAPRVADVREGDEPFCRFSQLVFGIGNALAALAAVELLAAGSRERAESLLDALEAPAALPTPRDWEELADVAPEHEELRAALRSLSIASPWLESRMRRAQHRLDRIVYDIGDDPVAAKWRLIKVLARLESRLGATPAAKLDLSALARSLAQAIG